MSFWVFRIILIVYQQDQFYLLTSSGAISSTIADSQENLIKFDVTLCLILLDLFITIICIYLNYKVIFMKIN